MPRKPRRRWNKNVAHSAAMSRQQLEQRVAKKRQPGAVTPGELEEDVLAFIAKRYDGRHLDIEVAQLGLSSVAHKLMMAHLRAVASK